MLVHPGDDDRPRVANEPDASGRSSDGIVDPAYRGLANITAPAWPGPMAVEHGLVAGLVVVGVVIDRLIRRLATDQPAADARPIRLELRLLVEAATGLGVAIALMSVIAQAAA